MLCILINRFLEKLGVNMKKITFLASIAVMSVSLSVGATNIAKPQQADILCELLNVGCLIVTKDGNGAGKEPPKGKN